MQAEKSSLSMSASSALALLKEILVQKIITIKKSRAISRTGIVNSTNENFNILIISF